MAQGLGLLLRLACLLRLIFSGCPGLLLRVLDRTFGLVLLRLRCAPAFLDLLSRLCCLSAELIGGTSGANNRGFTTRCLRTSGCRHSDVLDHGFEYILAGGDDRNGHVRCRRF